MPSLAAQVPGKPPSPTRFWSASAATTSPISPTTNGQAIDIPIYDFTIHRRTREVLHVEPQPIILVEGILVLAEAALRPLFDVKIFVDTDADIRLIRRLHRDIEERGRTADSVINQYLSTVRPMHMEFVEPSKRHADVIIPEGGFNTVAIDMVSDRISALLLRTQIGRAPSE